MGSSFCDSLLQVKQVTYKQYDNTVIIKSDDSTVLQLHKINIRTVNGFVQTAQSLAPLQGNVRHETLAQIFFMY